MAQWMEQVRRWHRLWHTCLVEHRGPGPFGDPSYWERRYRWSSGAPREWFVPSRVAARSAAATSRRQARVLHLGCGLSTLGRDVCELLGGRATNVDCSTTALAKLEAAVDDPFSQQSYVRWDAATEPPFGDFDLLLDKGTMDALQFSGSDALVNYFDALRFWLRRDALYLYWSDDVPEMKLDLLRAAFPPDDGWDVSFTVEDDDDDDNLAAGGFLGASSSSWTYYRYSVTRSEKKAFIKA
mmetsp:Transcript_7305/g.23917  ORF Transcript_7305/g.23917 Transcript_7305/m.23917 type:complete len:240 (-) Transcript_7305:198-917(-)